MKKISIVTATYNEQENIVKLCKDISFIMKKIEIDYEHIIIDNNSTDNTQNLIRRICEVDKNVKAIFNTRNFGHYRSAYYGILQSSGDATILYAADFQDPIELIPTLIKKWFSGIKVVFLKRTSSKENFFLENIKKFFYKLLKKVSNSKIIERTTGSGIFDRSVIDILKTINDPDPFFRGLVTEIEDNIEVLEFEQPPRLFGKSKNNFFTLSDLAIIALIKHSKLPLRIITFGGFFFSMILFIIGTFFLIYKLLFWDSFVIGIAPIILLISFGFSILIFMIGIIGEYVGVILTYQKSLPLSVEKERINFINDSIN